MDADCTLCKAIATEPEEEGNIEAYPGSMTFEILKCKDQKGHEHRYMIVSRDHVDHVAAYEEQTAKACLFRFMLMRKPQLSRSDIQSMPFDFYLLERTHASIKDHWHIVACTAYEGTDLDKIQDTDRTFVTFARSGDDIYP